MNTPPQQSLMGPHLTSIQQPFTHNLTSIMAALTDVVVPARCAGCGLWDTRLCEQCAALLRPPLIPVLQADAAGELPIWALAWYRAQVRNMVIAWKKAQREDLEPVMQQAGYLTGWSWAQDNRAALAQIACSSGLMLIPAPSGIKRRLSGRLVAARFADAVAQGIADAWSDPPTQPHGPREKDCEPRDPSVRRVITVLSADILRRPLTLKRTHQAGLSAKRRRSNRSSPPRVLTEVGSWHTLIVDDVVTTGSTIASCTAALESGGAQVMGALALAAAPPPAHSRPFQIVCD